MPDEKFEMISEFFKGNTAKFHNCFFLNIGYSMPINTNFPQINVNLNKGFNIDQYQREDFPSQCFYVVVGEKNLDKIDAVLDIVESLSEKFGRRPSSIILATKKRSRLSLEMTKQSRFPFVSQ